MEVPFWSAKQLVLVWSCYLWYTSEIFEIQACS